MRQWLVLCVKAQMQNLAVEKAALERSSSLDRSMERALGDSIQLLPLRTQLGLCCETGCG